jgi:intracellular septation protein A
VYFKAIGLPALTFVFMAAQVFWLARQAERAEASANSREAST